MKRKAIKVIVTALLLAGPGINLSHAGGPFDEFSRKEVHPVEVYGYFHTMNGDSDFPSGTVVKDSGFVGGIGFGGNVNNYLNLNTDIGYGGLNTTYSNSAIEDDTSVFEWNIGLDYNILKTRLTPMITGEVGIMNQNVDRTGYNETTFTYGLGGGLRYDITDRIFVKAVYRVDWTSFEGSSSATLYQGFFVSVGYKF